ncbi:MAG: hypothetical protein OXG91_06350 [bacterium]|nr:hypothetical protein [bacterium]MCY3951356.1 hypothetical protein [bacterium]
MSSVYVRYLLPALVVAACAVAALVGRRRRSRNDAVLDNSRRIVESSHTPAPTDPAAEQAWHRLHGGVLDGWMATHENLLDRASEDDFSGARAALDLANESTLDHLDTAVAAHPSPQRRAELSALRAAAQSTLVALAQGDYARARQHHLVYCDYRDLWRRQAAAGDGPRDP